MPAFNVHYTRTLHYSGMIEIEAADADEARRLFEEEVCDHDEDWTGEAQDHGATIREVQECPPLIDDQGEDEPCTVCGGLGITPGPYGQVDCPDCGNPA